MYYFDLLLWWVSQHIQSVLVTHHIHTEIIKHHTLKCFTLISYISKNFSLIFYLVEYSTSTPEPLIDQNFDFTITMWQIDFQLESCISEQQCSLNLCFKSRISWSLRVYFSVRNNISSPTHFPSKTKKQRILLSLQIIKRGDRKALLWNFFLCFPQFHLT